MAIDAHTPAQEPESAARFHQLTSFAAMLVLPIPLPSLLNQREHWAKRARRTKAQRAAVMLAGRKFRSLRGGPKSRWVVSFTRIAPRELDSDNLQGAFKAVRDAIAELLGVDDRSSRYCWCYAQQKGPEAIRVVVELRP